MAGAAVHEHVRHQLPDGVFLEHTLRAHTELRYEDGLEERDDEDQTVGDHDGLDRRSQWTWTERIGNPRGSGVAPSHPTSLCQLVPGRQYLRPQSATEATISSIIPKKAPTPVATPIATALPALWPAFRGSMRTIES